MQEIKICMCGARLDLEANLPIKLPCSHSCCEIGTRNSKQYQGNVKCPVCGQFTSQLPRTLPPDQNLMQALGQQNQVLNKIRETIQALNFQNQNLQQFKENFKKIQSKFLREVIQFIIQLLNTKYNKVNQEIDNFIRQNQDNLGFLEYFENLTKNNQPLNEFISQENLQALLDKSEITKQNEQSYFKIKNLENKLKTSLEEINKFIQNLFEQEGNRPEIKFESQVKEEQKQSYQSIRENKSQTNSYSTIMKDSNLKKTFQFEQGLFQQENILPLPKTYDVCTYIEQVQSNHLIISGENFNYDDKKFAIYEQNNLLNFQMNYGRYWHRTTSKNKELNFIISGNDSKQTIKECEIFDFKTKKFQEIANILEPVNTFGCCYARQDLSVFGGQTNEVFTDKIQIYDDFKNQWNLHQAVLKMPNHKSALFLENFNSCLLYYPSIFTTDIFDYNLIYTHGKGFKGEYHLFTSPILFKEFAYQYDKNSDLLLYDFGNAEWNQVY